jgi:MFS family permease
MFPQLGHTLPNALSAATFLLVNLLVSPEAFLSWGWRIPFLASALLVAVGLYIRLKVEETPVFKKEQKRSGPSEAPLLDAFRQQPGTMLRAAGVPLTTLTFVFVTNAFVANYGVQSLGLSRNTVLAAGVVSGLLFAVFTVLSAVISDRIGRRPTIGGAQIAAVLWSLVLFPVLNLGSILAYGLALCVTMTIAGLAYGAVGAFLPEQFPTRYRYTAAGVSYQFAGIVGGGVAPLLAPIVIASYGTTAFGVILAVMAAVAAACTFSLKETRGESLEWSPTEPESQTA